MKNTPDDPSDDSASAPQRPPDEPARPGEEQPGGVERGAGSVQAEPGPGEGGGVVVDEGATLGSDPEHSDDPPLDPHHHDQDHGHDSDSGYSYQQDHGYDPDYDHYHHDSSYWNEPYAGVERSGLIDIKLLLSNAERFRWFLIKSFAALVIGMAACLVAGNWVIQILEWPLRSVSEKAGSSEAMVLLALSPNNVSRLRMDTNEFNALFPGSDRMVELRLTAVPSGTNEVLGFKVAPVESGGRGKALVDLHVYDPMGAFWVAFQVAFYGGLTVAAPLIFFFLGQFLLPFLGGEFVEVRNILGRWVTASAGLFFGGMLFCYLFLLRVSLRGSVGFAEWMTFSADEWSATQYIGFVCKFTLAMGVGFQIPVVILLLVRIGILSFEKLWKFRPYWVVLNLAGSAFITPDGSPVTMLLMAAPLWVLYEISVLIAWRWSRAAAAKASESQ